MHVVKVVSHAVHYARWLCSFHRLARPLSRVPDFNIVNGECFISTVLAGLLDDSQ